MAKEKKGPPTVYEREAIEALREVLYRRRITFKELAKGLAALGEKVPPATLSNRINRGKFPLSVVIQCMHAMNMRELRIAPTPLSAEDVAALRKEGLSKTRRPQPKKEVATPPPGRKTRR